LGIFTPALQGCNRLLEGCDRRVPVAGVAVARLLAAQDLVRLLDGRVGEGRGEVDWGGDRVETPAWSAVGR
jgi:hypothetical protein